MPNPVLNVTGPVPGREPFIELNRRFLRIEKNTNAEAAALESYASITWFITGGMQWDDLVVHDRIVVLGEAGSGKTWEMRHQAVRRRELGETTFFVRLDGLIRGTLTERWDDGDHALFETWRSGSGEALFFLDSVDESKFRRADDFYEALDVFVRDVGREHLPRARVILSSRVSEWHPETDAEAVVSRIGASAVRTKDTSASETTGLLVVQIQPLDAEQIETFAKGRGVDNVAEFVAELDRAKAWEFARRPVDIVDLVSLWLRDRRIGSLTDLIESGLESKLRETAERSKGDLLTPERARQGAQALAAAVVLCRDFNFRVPDDALITVGLNGRLCLPGGWTDLDYQALLNRAIFDAASHGLIRFHHRRTQEYLAACWFGERMLRGCSIPELHDLFFDTSGSRRVLRPSLAPIAAWMCRGDADWNLAMREWVRDAAPAVHLRYGDPQYLPLPYKRSILGELAIASRSRKRMWFATEPATLVRLAEHALEADLIGYVLDPSIAVDFRAQLFEMARLARTRGMANAALAIVGSATESDDLKFYAIRALQEFDDEALRGQLAATMRSLPRIPERLGSVVLNTLFPVRADVGLLAEILEKVERGSRFSTDVSAAIRRIFTECVSPDDAAELLAKVVRLVEAEPHFVTNGSIAVSQRHGWLAKQLTPLVNAVFQRGTSSLEEIDIVVAALLILEAAGVDPSTQTSESQRLHSSAQSHSAVRRSFFWRKIAWMVAHGESQPSSWHRIFGYGTILGEMPDDFEWVVADVATGTLDNRATALRYALECWAALGRSKAALRRVHAAINGEASLETIFQAELATDARHARVRRWGWSRWYRDKLRWNVRRKADVVLDWWHRGLVQVRLLRKARRLAGGDLLHWLAELAMEAQSGGHSLSPNAWNELARKRGRFIANVVRRGCKRAWRTERPFLPHEKPDSTSTYNNVIVGLAGLEVAVADGDLDFAVLPSDEARLVTRYAVNEMNGFPPWFGKLVAAQPDAVRAVLTECIEHEWRAPAAPNRRAEVLNALNWHHPEDAGLIAGTLLALMRAGEPSTYATLEVAIGILLRQPAGIVAQLTAAAAARFAPGATAIPPGHVALWFVVWLQTDAEAALAALPATLESTGADLMVPIAANLKGRDVGGTPVLPQPSFAKPRMLRRLIPLVFQSLRIADDLILSGTVTARHDAQDFRNGLLRRLAEADGPEVIELLRELAQEPILADNRDWILHLIDEQLERRAEIPRWRERDVPEFERENEIDPRTEEELFVIVLKRLADLKYSVECADRSSRDELRKGDLESKLRRWLARKLTEKSRNRYVVPEEAVVDQEQRPDIRIMKPGVGPVSIEVKIAERGWTIATLLERLENQLVGQYMRDHAARYGVFLIGTFTPTKRWARPGDGTLVGFDEMINILTARAHEIETAHARRIRVGVMSMNFGS